MYFKKFATAINNKLPTRATTNSAGYDFYLPETTVFPAHQVTRIHTNVCLENDRIDWNSVDPYDKTASPEYVLLLYMRSSIGIKKHLMLANGTGVVDKDFAGYEIQLFIYNYGDEDITIEGGDRIVQGVFVPYLTVSDDNAHAERQGGFGSTGR